MEPLTGRGTICCSICPGSMHNKESSRFGVAKLARCTIGALRSPGVISRFLLALVASQLLGVAPAAAEPRCRRAVLQVYKAEGRLDLTCGGRTIFSAAATFGKDPGPPKRRRADGRTPEGRYVICSKARFRPLHIFFNLDYPNAGDVERALDQGQISGRHRRAISAGRRGGRCPRGITPLGSGIGIHGTARNWAWLVALWQQLSRLGGLHRFVGVTNGCVLLANDDLERLWPHVDAGVTRVVIHGRDPVAAWPLFARIPLLGRVVRLLDPEGDGALAGVLR
jgi:hypothetical protein